MAVREKEGQLRLKSHICLQGTEIPFSISECLYCQAAGGIQYIWMCHSFWSMLFHLKLWLFFPLDYRERNRKLLLCPVVREQGLHSLGKWMLSWIAGQVSPPSGKCICCQVTECLSFTFSLLVINIQLFYAKGILFNMDVLRLASQSTLWLRGCTLEVGRCGFHVCPTGGEIWT